MQLQEVPVSTLYGPNYKQWNFAQDIWTYYPYFPNANETFVPWATINECHVSNPTYTRLFKELAKTLDAAQRAELTHECMKMDYEGLSSGYIIPYFTPAIDGYTTRMHGLEPSKTSVPFGLFDLEHLWLD